MEPKKAVIREAEEIIADFARRQQELSCNARKQNNKTKAKKKSKRHNVKGIGLLLSLGISAFIWGLVFYFVF